MSDIDAIKRILQKINCTGVEFEVQQAHLSADDNVFYVLKLLSDPLSNIIEPQYEKALRARNFDPDISEDALVELCMESLIELERHRVFNEFSYQGKTEFKSGRDIRAVFQALSIGGANEVRILGVKKEPSEIKEILGNVAFRGWEYHVVLENENLYLQIRFDAPCNNSGEIDRQYCGKWRLSPFMQENEIVNKALQATIAAMEHETRELFRYNDQTIFGPHLKIGARTRMGGNCDNTHLRPV